MDDLPDIKPFQQKYQELESKLSDPEIFKDSSSATDLSRELNRLKKILSIFEDLRVVVNQLEQSRELLTDEEFCETAKDDIQSLEPRFSALRNQLVVEMLPEDPDKVKHYLGDKSRCRWKRGISFALDLYRMYCKYSESKHWTIECLSQPI